jgi:hypothetical protein
MKHTIFVILIISLLLLAGCVIPQVLEEKSKVTSEKEVLTKIEEKVIPEPIEKCKDECLQDQCNRGDYTECFKNEKGCMEKRYKGKSVGKCGIECLSDDNCSSKRRCNEFLICEDKPRGLTRDNPANIGEIVYGIDLGYSFSSFDVEIKVKEIERGSFAWYEIEEANMFNSKPETGFEYLIADIEIKLISSSDSKSVDFSSYYFDAVSDTGVVYDSAFVAGLDKDLSFGLYPGAKNSGREVFLVKRVDKTLMKFSKGDKELWFKLH